MSPRRVLSHAKPDYHLADFRDETIAPFDGDQITHFVNHWYNALTALEAMDDQTADQRVAVDADWNMRTFRVWPPTPCC